MGKYRVWFSNIRKFVIASGILVFSLKNVTFAQVIGSCIVVGDIVVKCLKDEIKKLSLGLPYGWYHVASAGEFFSEFEFYRHFFAGKAPDTTQIIACSPLYTDISDTVVCGYIVRFCFSSTITVRGSVLLFF